MVWDRFPPKSAIRNRKSAITCRGRYVLIGAAVGLAASVILGGIGLILLLRDDLPPMSEADLAAAEVRWRENGPSSYNMDLKLGGARPGTIHIEVRENQVTAMTRDGRSPKQRRTWDVWTVEGQFDTIRRELELAENPEREMQAEANTRLLLQAEFHPHYGYAQRYRRIVLGHGPEVSWEVTRFEIVDE